MTTRRSSASGPGEAADNTVPITSARRGRPRCPICGAPAVEAARPFCSRRCADVDLGRWLGETYRIPSAEAWNEEAWNEEAHPEDSDAPGAGDPPVPRG